MAQKKSKKAAPNQVKKFNITKELALKVRVALARSPLLGEADKRKIIPLFENIPD